MPILDESHNLNIDHSDVNEAGRDLSVNRSYDRRIDGHNFAGPSNYRQHRGGEGTSIFAENNEHMHVTTNVLTGNINFNYVPVEQNPPLTEVLVNILLSMFHYLKPRSKVSLSAENVGSGVDTLPVVDAAIVTQFPSHNTGSQSSSNARDNFKKAVASCEIYIESLLPLNYGYPLWYPQPAKGLPLEYRRRGISFGDLGIISRNGGFDFLFNTLKPAEDPINIPASLPHNFSTGYRPSLLTSCQPLLDPGDSNISNLDFKPDYDHDMKDIIFKCQDGDTGAILSLPDGASDTDLDNLWHWKQYILENSLNWYRYARNNCGRDVDRHSLYFVTGCTTSKTWGIATFNKPVSERNSVIIMGESNDTNKPSYIWKKAAGASTSRSGPWPDTALTYDDEASGHPPENQCLFLRGFKISLSEQAWESLWDKTEVKVTNDESSNNTSFPDVSQPKGKQRSTDNNHNLPQASSYGQEYRVSTNTVANFPEEVTPFHPLNEINNALLIQNPQASIAITHDNVWRSLFVELRNHNNMEQMFDIVKGRCVIGSSEEFKAVTLECNSSSMPDVPVTNSQSDPSAAAVSIEKTVVTPRESRNTEAEGATLTNIQSVEAPQASAMRRHSFSAESAPQAVFMGAWPPIAGQGAVSIHPLLTANDLMFDLSLPEPSPKRYHAGHNKPEMPIPESELSQFATNPPFTVLRIECDKISKWPIEIGRSTGVTVGDVLNGIHARLQEGIRNTDWNALSSNEQKEVNKAYRKRCRNAGAAEGLFKTEGVKIVDLLCEKIWFRWLATEGSSPEKLKMFVV